MVARYEHTWDLILLVMMEFDIILGMTWLQIFEALIDSYLHGIILTHLMDKRPSFKDISHMLESQTQWSHC